MIIYNTNPVTGEYIGQGVAQVSPLEPEVRDESGAVIRQAVYLIPAHAVTVAPPVAKPGKRRHWNGAAWEYRDEPASVPGQSESAPEPDVAQCSPWQVRKGFNARGIRAAVEQYVAGASQEVQDGYEFATVWKANDPFVLEAGAGLGMTPQQVAEFVAWCATL